MAGPFTTDPLVLYCDPWHGHTNRFEENPVTMHCSCVQTAVSALKEFSARRVTRYFSVSETCTRAALPGLLRGEPLPIFTVTVPNDSLALIVASCVIFPPPPGLVGLPLPPPPHPSMSDATVTNEIA